MSKSVSDKKIYTPDVDQSAQMTKDLLMKICNDKTAKEKIKEDDTIRYCHFVYSSFIFIIENTSCFSI